MACVDPAVMSGRTRVSSASALDIGREREVIRAYAVLEKESGQNPLESQLKAECLTSQDASSIARLVFELGQLTRWSLHSPGNGQ